MPMTAFMEIPGVKGDALQKHVLDQIIVVAVTQETVAEIDPTSAMPKPKTRHRPLVITKRCDSASPLLYDALDQNKEFDKVRLNFWRIPPFGGAEENHLSMVITDVQVAFLRLKMLNNRTPGPDLPVGEELGLTYKTITWEWHAGGNVGGTAPKEQDSTSFLAAPFETSAEAFLRQTALDLLKSTLSGTGGDILKLVKGDSAPACCKPPPPPPK